MFPFIDHGFSVKSSNFFLAILKTFSKVFFFLIIPTPICCLPSLGSNLGSLIIFSYNGFFLVSLNLKHYLAFIPYFMTLTFYLKPLASCLVDSFTFSDFSEFPHDWIQVKTFLTALQHS